MVTTRSQLSRAATRYCLRERWGTPQNRNDEDGDGALATDLESGGGNGRGEAGADAPTRELPAALDTASEDRCSACGAPLAHDQRYCVDCGERRGQSRFPVAQPVTEVRSRRVRPGRPPRTPGMSAGMTLVLGVGVLLLAIGLGVLIGSLANKTPTTHASAPAVHITVQGGGGGAAAATPTTTTTAHLTKKSQAKLKAAAAATAPPTAAVQKKATAAAGKVLGNSSNLAPPTVTTGQSCNSSAAGCQGGKFNGNFFGQ